MWPYADSLDARAHAWSRTPPTPTATLAQALHDHAIDEALTTWVTGRHLVGVMGAHAADRSSASYADAARLGWMLGQHHVVATGGGPGAMEAANLGGRLAGIDARPRGHRRGDAGRRAVVPPVGRRLGAQGLRRAGRRDRPGVAGDPHVVLRPRAAQRVRHRDRQVLPQRQPRGDPAPGVRRRASSSCPARPARCRRSSRTPARTTTAPPTRWRRWCWSAGRTGPTGCPPGPCSRSLARGRPMEEHIHLVDTVDEVVGLFVGELTRSLSPRPPPAARRHRRSRGRGCRGRWWGSRAPRDGVRTRARRRGRRRSTSSRASG